MDIVALLKDKGFKPKEKTEAISKAVLDLEVSVEELISAASTAKDPDKATCIEALEFATKQHPQVANDAVLDFVVQCLPLKAPRVKWESAKVVGNIASCFPDRLDLAISHLLVNAEHEGTVVRWSAAFALGEILKLKLPRYTDLSSTLQAICDREEKASIQKIYRAAMKAAAK